MKRKQGFKINQSVLFDAMHAKGIKTLAELKRKTGLGDMTVYGLSHHRTYLRTLQKVSDVLDVPVSELIEKE